MECLHKDLLIKYRDCFIKSIEIDKIKENLISIGILNDTDIAFIEKETLNETKIEKLLDILPTKGKISFKEFCKILEKTYPQLLTLMFLGSYDGGDRCESMTLQKEPKVKIVDEYQTLLPYNTNSPSLKTSLKSDSFNLMGDDSCCSHANKKFAYRSILYPDPEGACVSSPLGDGDDHSNNSLPNAIDHRQPYYSSLLPNTPPPPILSSIHDVLRPPPLFLLTPHDPDEEQHVTATESAVAATSTISGVGTVMSAGESGIDLNYNSSSSAADLVLYPPIPRAPPHSTSPITAATSPPTAPSDAYFYYPPAQQSYSVASVASFAPTIYSSALSGSVGGSGKAEYSLSSGSSELLSKMYDTALEKYERAKREHEALVRAWSEREASHESALSRARTEASRARSKLDDALEQRSTLLRENFALKQHCAALSHQLEASFHDASEAREQLQKVTQQRDEAIKEMNHALAMQIRAAKDLERRLIERNAAVQEYSLVMAERDTVHKEMDKLQEDVADAKKKTQELEDENKELAEELQLYRKEIECALADRDKAINEGNHVKDKYGEVMTLKSLAEKERDEALKDYSGVIAERDAARHEMSQALDHRNQILQELYRQEHMEDFNKEEVGKRLNALQLQLTECQKEADIARKRRDWAFKERDKIVTERDLYKQALIRAQRGSKPLQDDSCGTSSTILDGSHGEIGEKTYDDACQNAMHDDQKLEWESVSYHIDMILPCHTMDDLGIVVGPLDELGLRIEEVSPKSPFYGRLRKNDCITEMNDVDLKVTHPLQAAQTVFESQPSKLRVVANRTKIKYESQPEISSDVKHITLPLPKAKELGQLLSSLVYVKDITEGSTSGQNCNLNPGDQILAINGQYLDGKGVAEVMKLMSSCRDPLTLTVTKTPCNVREVDAHSLADRMLPNFKDFCKHPISLLDHKMRASESFEANETASVMSKNSSGNTHNNQATRKKLVAKFEAYFDKFHERIKRKMTAHPYGSADILDGWESKYNQHPPAPQGLKSTSCLSAECRAHKSSGGIGEAGATFNSSALDHRTCNNKNGSVKWCDKRDGATTITTDDIGLRRSFKTGHTSTFQQHLLGTRSLRGIISLFEGVSSNTTPVHAKSLSNPFSANALIAPHSSKGPTTVKRVKDTRDARASRHRHHLSQEEEETLATLDDVLCKYNPPPANHGSLTGKKWIKNGNNVISQLLKKRTHHHYQQHMSSTKERPQTLGFSARLPADIKPPSGKSRMRENHIAVGLASLDQRRTWPRCVNYENPILAKRDPSPSPIVVPKKTPHPRDLASAIYASSTSSTSSLRFLLPTTVKLSANDSIKQRAATMALASTSNKRSGVRKERRSILFSFWPSASTSSIPAAPHGINHKIDRPEARIVDKEDSLHVPHCASLRYPPSNVRESEQTFSYASVKINGHNKRPTLPQETGAYDVDARCVERQTRNYHERQNHLSPSRTDDALSDISSSIEAPLHVSRSEKLTPKLYANGKGFNVDSPTSTSKLACVAAIIKRRQKKASYDSYFGRIRPKSAPPNKFDPDPNSLSPKSGSKPSPQDSSFDECEEEVAFIKKQPFVVPETPKAISSIPSYQTILANDKIAFKRQVSPYFGDTRSGSFSNQSSIMQKENGGDYTDYKYNSTLTRRNNNKPSLPTYDETSSDASHSALTNLCQTPPNPELNDAASFSSVPLMRPKVGEVRTIVIDKSTEPLGIQIECVEHSHSISATSSNSVNVLSRYQSGGAGGAQALRGIFISSVSVHGLAYLAGLQVGDQMLEVCGINLRNATYPLAANVLRNCGQHMTILVQYNPDKYFLGEAENRTSASPPIKYKTDCDESSVDHVTTPDDHVIDPLVQDNFKMAPEMDQMPLQQHEPCKKKRSWMLPHYQSTLTGSATQPEPYSGNHVSWSLPNKNEEINDMTGVGYNTLTLRSKNQPNRRLDDIINGGKGELKLTPLGCISANANPYYYLPRPRIVTIQKYDTPPFSTYRRSPCPKSSLSFGIQLIGGNACGIFVKEFPDEALNRVGLMRGDHILEINGTDVRSFTAEEAALELNKYDVVDLLVQHNIPKFMETQKINGSSGGDSFYVKALFDNTEPGPAGIEGFLDVALLKFRRGDMLHVDDTMHAGKLGFWRARILDQAGNSIESGLIPSKYKLEESYNLPPRNPKDLANPSPRSKPSYRPFSSENLLEDELATDLSSIRLGGAKECWNNQHQGVGNWGSISSKRITFLGGTVHLRSQTVGKKSKLANNFHKLLHMAAPSNSNPGHGSHQEQLLYGYGKENPKNFYRKMDRLDVKHQRPLVVYGPFVNEITEKMIELWPEKFSRCEHEIMKGSSKMMEQGLADNIFFDYKRAGNHYEYLTYDNIKQLNQSKTHCVVDINPEALQRLRFLKIHPIIILIKFKNSKFAKEFYEMNFKDEDTTFMNDLKKSKGIQDGVNKLGEDIRSSVCVYIPSSVVMTKICEDLMLLVNNEQQKVIWVPQQTIPHNCDTL